MNHSWKSWVRCAAILVAVGFVGAILVQQVWAQAKGPADFDFALVYLGEIDIFYIIPVDVFLGYRSGISLVETTRRQRKPRSAGYRDAWELIAAWVAARETATRAASGAAHEAQAA